MLGWMKKKKNNGAVSVPDAADNSLQEKQPSDGDTAETVHAVVPAVPEVEERTDTGDKSSQNRQQENQKGLFKRLQERLTKTRDSLVSRVDTLFLGKKEIDADLLDELEEILITADLGVNTTLDLLEEIRQRVSRQELNDPQALKIALKEKILSFFDGYDEAGMQLPVAGPLVIMVVGVNGVGKTTTIGKIAHKFVRNGQNVLLIAGDTFRAAAIEQLQVWGRRVGAEVVATNLGADPSSVIYDGLDYAAARNFDVIIVDTAGRLHTKVNLMEELKKIKRVINKKIESAPHEIMLILDATTGQNSISQAKLFNDAVGLTGLTLTKLDGTAKGGIIVNISHHFNIPIRFIGIGEQLEDLRDFKPQEFIEALFINSSRKQDIRV
jgi:fused signal recognition particle receptor